jgi:hypothetical protein
MVRLMVLSAALVVALANVAGAAEGCGANRWRDPNGVCHWFHTPYGSLRGTHFACPPGMHVGPEGHKCWPN